MPETATMSPGAPAGQRDTRQRAAIRAAIERSTRPLLPAEILEQAQRDVEAMGIATVYRNLKLLVDAHEIRTVELPGEAARYETARHAHHHHFQCKRCARVFDVHACPGDFASMAPKGFKVEAHELTLYGLCAECGQRADRAPT
ncbi:Fur family transcriptional regulator [Variovorax guangxiensis]|nr:transcriptional repressor [Variovorax guangxiensis]